MLTVTSDELDRITVLRLASLLRDELDVVMPGFVGDSVDGVSLNDLAEVVRDVRDLLAPWGLATERVIVKFSLGSLLIGKDLLEADPNLIEVLRDRSVHRYKREAVLDESVERLLAMPTESR